MFSFWSTTRLTKLIQYYKHLSIFIVSTKYHIDLMKWLRCCKIDFLAGSTFLQNFSKRLWIFFEIWGKRVLWIYINLHLFILKIFQFIRSQDFLKFMQYSKKKTYFADVIHFCFVLRKPHLNNILRNFRHLQKMLFLYIIHQYKYITVLHEKGQMVFYNKEVT